ncbi:hypothetical protein F5883DRAFT_153896 [Diaporthe sp. PMI_573]|nr:hypothetical protein F5883DRAFT_152896 [Diaporthaceae sp. PMI_573]KAH8757926.1 hypothetical protein F5883DRAFT_153896 [Diaporthaceae sp. PMI_573]
MMQPSVAAAAAKLVEAQLEGGISGDGGDFDAGHEDNTAEYTLRVPLCSTCQKHLVNLRWECRECTDTHFCSACRTTHSHHRMKAFTQPIISGDTSSCATDSDSESDAEIQTGADTADDPTIGRHNRAKQTDNLDEERQHGAKRFPAQTESTESLFLDWDEVDSDLRDDGVEQRHVIRRPRSQVSHTVVVEGCHEH